TWTGRPDVFPRTARELAACRGGTLDDIGDLVKAHAENVVEQESRALQWRQPLEGHHQWQRDVVHGFCIVILDDGLRQPDADVGFPLASRRLELIETEPGHGGREPGGGLSYRIVLRPSPPDPGFLNDVFGV